MKNQSPRRSSQKENSPNRWEWLKSKMEKFAENRPPIGREERMELLDLPQEPPRGYSSESPGTERDGDIPFGFLGMDEPPPQDRRPKGGKDEAPGVHQHPDWVEEMWGWEGPPSRGTQEDSTWNRKSSRKTQGTDKRATERNTRRSEEGEADSWTESPGEAGKQTETSRPPGGAQQWEEMSSLFDETEAADPSTDTDNARVRQRRGGRRAGNRRRRR